MTVVKLETQILHFFCEGCQVVKQIDIKDLNAYQDNSEMFCMMTPKCKCGSILYIIPRLDKDIKATKASHLRRVLAYKVLTGRDSKGYINKVDVKKHIAKIEKYYANDTTGKSDLTNEKAIVKGNTIPTELL